MVARQSTEKHGAAYLFHCEHICLKNKDLIAGGNILEGNEWLQIKAQGRLRAQVDTIRPFTISAFQ
jgi:hypothetical protein